MAHRHGAHQLIGIDDDVRRQPAHDLRERSPRRRKRLGEARVELGGGARCRDVTGALARRGEVLRDEIDEQLSGAGTHVLLERVKRGRDSIVLWRQASARTWGKW